MTAPSVETAPAEGWAWPVSKRHAHYYRDGAALCGEPGEVPELLEPGKPESADCGLCRRKFNSSQPRLVREARRNFRIYSSMQLMGALTASVSLPLSVTEFMLGEGTPWFDLFRALSGALSFALGTVMRKRWWARAEWYRTTERWWEEIESAPPIVAFPPVTLRLEQAGEWLFHRIWFLQRWFGDWKIDRKKESQ